MGGISHVVLLLFFTIASICEAIISHPGHNLPLGSHMESIPAKRLNYLPSPSEFYRSFVKKRIPVVMKSAMRASEAFSNWQSDDYLRKKFGEMTFNVEVSKKENRSEYGFSIQMEEFLDVYKADDIYMVDELPPPMIDEWQIPKPLLCGGFTEHLMYAFIWFSSGDTRSVLHTDSGENLHCVVSGQKEWVLIEPKFSEEIGPEHKQKGFYDIDVDKVDMNIYQNLSSIPWYSATLDEGDCLFLPHPWIHQVHSYGKNGRNMGINVWWEPFEFEFNDCANTEENLPDYAMLLDFEFHPEIQVREDLMKIRQKDGNIHASDFFLLLEERLQLEGIHMEIKYVEKMFEILEPGCDGIIKDPYSITFDKLRAGFDYILNVSDELYEEQVLKETDQDNPIEWFEPQDNHNEL